MCLISACLSHGYQHSPMLNLILCVVKCWQHVSNHQRPPRLALTCWCLWASTSMACIPTPNVVRHGTCQHNYTVDRGLVISFCGQPLYCNWPYYLTTRFWSPLSHIVSAQPFPDRPRTMSCESAQIGSCPITWVWLWPVTDHVPLSWRLPLAKFEGGLKLLHKADDDTVIWLESTATTAVMKWNEITMTKYDIRKSTYFLFLFNPLITTPNNASINTNLDGTGRWKGQQLLLTAWKNRLQEVQFSQRLCDF